MSNRLTKGKALVGSLQTDSSGELSSGTVSSSSGGFKFESGSYDITRKIKAISFTVPGTSAETDTTFDVPDSGLVHDVWVKITTASSASGVLDVGLAASSGDADGFVINLSTSSTGIFSPGPVFTAATSGDLITGNTLGDLLSASATGTTDLGSWGYVARRRYATTALPQKSVVYAHNSTTATTAGVIYIEYSEI